MNFLRIEIHLNNLKDKISKNSSMDVHFCWRKWFKKCLIYDRSKYTLFSCEMDILTPPETSKVKHNYSVENLQPNETYYWKVVAIGENGINSECVVQSFITGE